jgi:serine/threonine-protein kinase HipA
MTGTTARMLDVFVNERLVGQLRTADDIWSFSYAPSWQQDPEAFSLAPGLPKETTLHTDGSSMRRV